MADNEGEEPPDPHDFTDPSPEPASDDDLAVIGAALHARGLTRVVIRYEGSGDSGSVEEIACMPEGIALPPGLEDQLRDVAECYCPDGYEDNDGGYGVLTLYLRDGLAMREHANRLEDAEEISAEPARLPNGLRRRLARRGVTTITADFNGYGESGRIEDLAVQPESIVLGRKLQDAVEDALTAQLPDGWERNEGSYGQFTVDVGAGQIVLKAAWRVETVESTVIRWRWRE